MELYVHIPFCVSKCRYCDFLSFPLCSVDAKLRDRYIDALIRELHTYKDTFASEGCDTVFIGGGTPSVIAPQQMEKLLAAIDEICFCGLGPMNREYTIECNPGTLDREKLQMYRRYGVNRLSLGLQSTDDKELKLLGRIHTYAEFFQSYNLARECGFDNINVDLISAIPGQTVSLWEKTLRKVAELKPEHISAYSLIVEPGTLMWEEYGEEAENIAKGKDAEGSSSHVCLPSEDEEREIYRMTRVVLGEYGYHRYEISNYSLDGRESKHNLGYWTGEKYVGIGLGAASYVGVDRSKDMLRYHNTESLEEYLYYATGKRFVDESLDRQALMSEFVILRLRLTCGFLKKSFEEVFGTDVYEVFGDVIRKHLDLGLLKDEDGRIFFTEDGMDVSNTVMADMLI